MHEITPFLLVELPILKKKIPFRKISMEKGRMLWYND